MRREARSSGAPLRAAPTRCSPGPGNGLLKKTWPLLEQSSGCSAEQRSTHVGKVGDAAAALIGYAARTDELNEEPESDQQRRGNQRDPHVPPDDEDHADSRGAADRILVPHSARQCGRSEEHTSELQSRVDLV